MHQRLYPDEPELVQVAYAPGCPHPLTADAEDAFRFKRLQRVADNDAEYVTAPDMLSELREDEKALVLRMRAVHDLCDDTGDVATASLLENWIDQTQRRIWFLFEATRA